MGFSVNLDLIADQEEVAAVVVNRPLLQLLDNTNYLKAIADVAPVINNVLKSSDYSLGNETTLLVDATGSGITITLPLSSTKPNWTYTVKKIDASVNAVTIQRAGADLIDGAATKVLSTQYDKTTVTSGGPLNKWFIIS